MANELRFAGDVSQTGLTVTARVYDTNGAQVGGDVSCPEVDNVASPGYYIGDFPVLVVTSAIYLARFFDVSDDLLAQSQIEWNGTDEVTNLYISENSATTPAAIWNYAIEGTRTAQGMLRIIGSSAAGVLSGANPGSATTILIRDTEDTKTRIDADVDPFGNRTAVTLDDS